MPATRRQFLQTLAATPLGAQGGSSPNVLLIMTDDMGYADLGCYGVKDTKTPNIDRLAKEGVRFTQCYSAGPVCTPTRAALMTGRWQQRVGLEWAFPAGYRGYGLDVSETSLPRMMKDRGYATGMFGKWHLGYEPEYGPNAHGFDEFYGLLSGNVDHYSHKEVTGEDDWYENTKAVKDPGYSTDLLSQRAINYIDRRAQNPQQPFFVYLAYNSTHWPFQAPNRPNDIRDRPTWLAGTRKDYIEMMESIDSGVGRILATLDKHKLASNTLVIFTNDNGGERLSNNQPLFHHKATLWEGGIRVPGIMRWPGLVPAGKVSTQPVISMDFTATVLNAAKASPPSGRMLDGVDLLPLVTGKQPLERTFYWRIDRADRKQKAIRKGKYKLMRDGAIDNLYDIEADQGERVDLHYRMPEKSEELRQALATWEKDLAANPPRKAWK